MTKPHDSHMPLHCEKCGHVWVETIRLPMEAQAFCDRIKAWSKRCVGCGQTSGNNIMLLTGDAAEEAIAEHLTTVDV